MDTDVETINTARVLVGLKALAGLTNDQLGALAGMSGGGIDNALKRSIRGEGNLLVRNVAAVAHAFGIPLHVFFLPYEEALQWIIANGKLNVDLTDNKGIEGSGWSVHARQLALGVNGLVDLLTVPNYSIDLR